MPLLRDTRTFRLSEIGVVITKTIKGMYSIGNYTRLQNNRIIIRISHGVLSEKTRTKLMEIIKKVFSSKTKCEFVFISRLLLEPHVK